MLRHAVTLRRTSLQLTSSTRLPIHGPALTRQAFAGSRIASRSLFTRKTPAQKLKNRVWTGVGILLGGLFAVYAYDSSAGVHRWLFIPLLHAYTRNDPEQSHRIAVKILGSGLAPIDRTPDQEDVLAFELFGRRFSNPVGLAAGFDKHGEAVDGLFNLGFSYVEIGSVTPKAQEGNPQPRLFRLPSTQSVINRYGFNSEGHIPMLARLKERIHAFLVNNALTLPPTSFPTPTVSAAPLIDPIDAMLKHRTDAEVIDSISKQRSLHDGKVLAINLGKNKVSPAESISDYVEGVKKLGPYADVLVVNVSSPNTPGLRSMQKRDILRNLLASVVDARDGLVLQHKPAVVLKIAPDLSKQEVRDIAAVAEETKIDGIIVSNTTVSRPVSAGTDPTLQEAGGLSGPPLKPLSIRTLRYLYELTSGSIPLIGCGGISTGRDALDYARAGASFVQLYTAFGYQGVGLPRMLKNEIADTLKAEGKTWKELVGSGIDQAALQARARENNPANILSLEQEATSGLQQLREQVEKALYGKSSSPIPSSPMNDDLDWPESPDTALQATAPSGTVADPASAQSGYIPAGVPQVIIHEKVPAHKQLREWTADDVQAKLDEAKQKLSAAGEQLEDAAAVVRDAAVDSANKFQALGKEIKDDPLVDTVKAAGQDSVEGFRRLGEEIKDDPLAHQAARTTKGAADQASDAFRQLGAEIREDKFAKQAGETTKAAAEDAGQAFKQLGREIRDDRFPREAARATADGAREAAHTTAAAARDAGENFAAIGRDIRDDQFARDAARNTAAGAREAAHTTAAAARDAGENFRAIGRDIHDDQFARDAARSTAAGARHAAYTTAAAARDAGENFKAIGRDIRDDQFARDAARSTAAGARDAAHTTAAAARGAGDGFAAIGRDIRHDPLAHDAKVVTKESAKDAAANFRALGREVANDDFAAQIKNVTAAAARDALRKFKQLGREVKDDDFYAEADRVTREAVHTTANKFRKAGRSVRDDAFAQEAVETAKASARDAGHKFRQVGKDIKDDAFLDKVQDIFANAARDATNNFAKIAHDIRHDPAYDAARSVARDMKDEAGTAVLREGPTGEPQRSGGGIWSLGSTFGMRAEVTSESKRLV